MLRVRLFRGLAAGALLGEHALLTRQLHFRSPDAFA
jgi:hypothetical protein